MARSILGRLDSLEAATPSRHRPPVGCTIAELGAHVAALSPRDQALCVKALTEEELERTIDALREFIVIGEAAPQ